ncbi:reversion-inducing cysteine-rich protein with Kazal motifs-like [Ruditapes philippinarum]|uniref:reversion-inducing cysteine-rich protein with Kazal motifs-like n=1 Tax=Ruditapes philippinarum TaxID=129788 RepID=UPI00295B5C65|nr:reversion-inducing cysteine-rich protein with Kazal motifs-like [Ruditapes philippinarum]
MFGAVGFILFILCDLTAVLAVNTYECCSTIPEDAKDCRDICRQLSMSGNQVEQISLLASAPSKCPQHLLDFWSCAKKSLPALLELGTFSGRPCCNMTKTKACREACIKAQSEADVEAQCSHSTEDAKLYECIDRQRDGEKCCGKASATDSLECKATCWNMYLTNTISDHESKRSLRQYCTGRNREVWQCVQKQTRTTRQSSNIESLHCCEHTDNETCKKVCTETLRSGSNPDQIIEQVIGSCGNVDIIHPLYKCFLVLNYSYRSGNTAGMDSSKLHCCEKAETKRCGTLCAKAHAWKWDSIARFEENCGYLSSPISTQELQMHSCLKDVEQPCQLGCQGLQYCTNMNNRPAEHFRSCTAEADTAARDDILMWQKGRIKLPNLSIPVKDVRNCEPKMWKAIACTYQIKPCSRKPTPTQICREDCVYIMNKCVDTSQLQGQVVTDVCKRLPIEASGECISVKPYTVESPVQSIHSEVSHPCKSNTCKDDEVCVLYRRKCRHSAKCPHYVCRKGCKMGQVSRVMVPYSSDVIIPVNKNGDSNSCRRYKVCHCSHNGMLGHCTEIPCIKNGHCTLDNGVIESGEHFTTGCSDCVCHAGEKICSQRQCPAMSVVNQMEFADVQNCQCSRKYKPVCASNGKTYPNQCISRCAGQTLFSQGPCNVHDPCASNPCETGYSCIVNKQVCFGHENSPCLQYKCVAVSECNEHDHEPVCDTKDMEYTNDCVLLSKSKTMKYRGHCQVRQCSNSGSVCGHDGETYNSECAALAARITVDYFGPCKTFGYSLATVDGKDPKETLCSDVECPAVVPKGCHGIIPPWSCCPICAAELRVLVSSSLAHMSIDVKKGPVTLNKIITALSQMISVSECDVFGYLGYDNDIIILVAPVTDEPTILQTTACVKEAERFEYLIKSRSPSVTSNLLLTPLIYAKLRTHVMTMTSAASAFYTQPMLLVTLTLMLIHFSHKIRGFV